MSTAVFPGTFDPPTYGHLNIIERASRLFDQIDVVVSINPDKKTMFTEEERLSMLKNMTSHIKNVNVHCWNGLVVEYCRKTGSKTLLRGIRNTVDFSYEFDLSLVNRSLSSDVETLFIPTDQKFFLIRSSSIKELAKFNGDISAMVPPEVEKKLKEKCRGL